MIKHYYLLQWWTITRGWVTIRKSFNRDMTLRMYRSLIHDTLGVSYRVIKGNTIVKQRLDLIYKKRQGKTLKKPYLKNLFR